MNSVEQYLTDKLKAREIAGNLRCLAVNKYSIDFFSNDYLGLITNGTIAELINQVPQNLCTTGSTGSRLISGNNKEVENLEQTIAGFHKGEAALLFNSGYDANTGLLSCILAKDAVVFYDELCHASIIDGIRLSLCQKKFKFKHNNLADLQDKIIRQNGANKIFVIAESVYSMDGDYAPLTDMAELCKEFGAYLIVDEAHATGVVGKHGEGLVCELGLQNSVFARVHTFGKALGCHGAAVVVSIVLKQYLINFSRQFIYTTALPGHSVQAINCVYQYLADSRFSNQKLHDIIEYFRSKIKESGSNNWLDSTSPIQGFITGNNQMSINIGLALQKENIQVKPILHPTVPLGKERLRFCLHIFNTEEEMDLLFEVMANES